MPQHACEAFGSVHHVGPVNQTQASGLVAAAFTYQTAYWSGLVWEILFLTESPEQKISLGKGHA